MECSGSKCDFPDRELSSRKKRHSAFYRTLEIACIILNAYINWKFSSKVEIEK